MRTKWFWILTLATAVLAVLSCCMGKYPMSPAELWQILTGAGQESSAAGVFWQIRLPRVVLTMCSGAALALSGLVYQGIFRNPLASPDVLGVGSGCSVGAMLSILYFGGSALMGVLLPFAAGLAAVGAALALAALMKGGRVFGMVIAGIVVGALCNSLMMTLKYTADPNRDLPVIEYWMMGSFNGALWSDVFRTVPVMAVAAAGIFMLRRPLQILLLGDDEAASLGVSVRMVRLMAVVFATLLACAVTACAGLVAWIGLIVPHAVRILAGESFRDNLYQVMPAGAALLLGSDLLARCAFETELPVSILTTMFGAAALILFLIRQRRRSG